MDWSECKKLLAEEFTVNDVIAGDLIHILDQEDNYGGYVLEKFRGHRIVLDCFFAYYAQSLVLSRKQELNSLIDKNSDYYLICLAHVLNFRTLRASDRLLLKGYPLAGYALLRELKDQSMFLAATLGGLTTWTNIWGLPIPSTVQDPEELKRLNKKKRIAEEKRILGLMLRNQSGLKAEFLKLLQLWEDLFNREVHGSLLSHTSEGSQWIRGQQDLSVAPTPNDLSIAMYINRSIEIGWMLLRVLPILQLQPQSFGEIWERRWFVLDNAFRIHVEALENQEKPIATAIIELVNTKFAFDPSDHFKMSIS